MGLSKDKEEWAPAVVTAGAAVSIDERDEEADDDIADGAMWGWDGSEEEEEDGTAASVKEEEEESWW